MPRAGQTKPAGMLRLPDRIAIGVLTQTFPPELVDRVIAKTGRAERRRRLLPARVVLYYTLAMCLFAQVGYEEVMRLLVEGLAWARRWQGRWQVPHKSSIARARRRLGPAPLRALFAEVARPLATPSDQGRVVSRVAAGRVGRGHPGRGGHPRQRGGVRPAHRRPRAGGVPAGAPGGAGGVRHPWGRGRGHGRAAPGRGLAGTVAGSLAWPGNAAAGRPGPVCPGAVAHLAGDRGGAAVALPPGRQAGGAGGLRGWFLAQRAGPKPAQAQTGRGAGRGLPRGGSRPPWRAGGLPAHHHHPGLRACPGGGAAGTVSAAVGDRDRAGRAQDPPARPRDGAGQPRSRRVRQEVWAHLLVHYAIRTLMHQAALGAEVDPDRLSLTRSLHIARRQVTGQAAFSPSAAGQGDAPGGR